MAQKIIAHRGYKARYPENTLPAFEAAISGGADAVELDVQFCRDGTPVVFHDHDLLRVTGRRGQIADLGADQLRAFSAHEPERLGETFRGTPIPTLAEAVAALAPHGRQVFVEIKRDTLPHHDIPGAVQRVLEDCRPLGDQLVIISFDDGLLREARSLAPVAVGWVLPDWGNAEWDRAEVVEPDYLFCDLHRLPPPPAPLWPGRWRWAVYEVNDVDTARRLEARGVEMIETEAVETLVAGLRQT